MYYCDQWRRPAKPDGDAVNSGASAVPSSPLHTRNTSPAVMNPVLTPKKKLAKEVVHKLKVNRCVISLKSYHSMLQAVLYSQRTMGSCLSYLYRIKLVSDKCGIQISSDPETTNGRVLLNIQHIEKVAVVKFHIQNTATNSIYFNYYTALHRIRCFTLVDEKRVTRISPLLLCPGSIRCQELTSLQWLSKRKRCSFSTPTCW